MSKIFCNFDEFLSKLFFAFSNQKQSSKIFCVCFYESNKKILYNRL